MVNHIYIYICIHIFENRWAKHARIVLDAYISYLVKISFPSGPSEEPPSPSHSSGRRRRRCRIRSNADEDERVPRASLDNPIGSVSTHLSINMGAHNCLTIAFSLHASPVIV